MELEIPINPVQRVLQIGKKPPDTDWKPEDFRHAVQRRRKLHEELQDLFGVKYWILGDATAIISPDWRLIIDDTFMESVDVPYTRSCHKSVALSFVKWEYCPLTKGLPNPYDPWIQIWEHDGSFSVEHSVFIDIFDNEGMRCGAIVSHRP